MRAWWWRQRPEVTARAGLSVGRGGGAFAGLALVIAWMRVCAAMGCFLSAMWVADATASAAKWSIQTPPAPAWPNGQLRAVSCRTIACTAVGYFTDRSNRDVECPRGRGHLIAWVCPTRLEGCGVHAKDASAVSRGVPS